MNYIATLLLALCIFFPAAGQASKNRYALPLKHLNAENIANVLTAALRLDKSDELILTADKSNNTLIIVTAPENYSKVERLIKELDVALPEVECTVSFPY